MNHSLLDERMDKSEDGLNSKNLITSVANNKKNQEFFINIIFECCYNSCCACCFSILFN